MMKISRVLSVMALFAIILSACDSKKKKLAFYADDTNTPIESINADTGSSEDYSELPSDDIVVVPFIERGGVKFVNVTVNGFGFEMIFDTGCSGTLISIAEANYLYQKGYLVKEDILGTSQSQIADGSIVENMVVNLKEVILDGKIRCVNVQATVSSNNNAPLLLGNEVLNRVAAYAVDNENKTINFKLR